jgi:hypothetical protein
MTPIEIFKDEFWCRPDRVASVHVDKGLATDDAFMLPSVTVVLFDGRAVMTDCPTTPEAVEMARGIVEQLRQATRVAPADGGG